MFIYGSFNYRVLPVDLSDPEATRVSVDKARQLFGRVDMLVNNAGRSHDSHACEVYSY